MPTAILFGSITQARFAVNKRSGRGFSLNCSDEEGEGAEEDQEAHPPGVAASADAAVREHLIGQIRQADGRLTRGGAGEYGPATPTQE